MRFIDNIRGVEIFEVILKEDPFDGDSRSMIVVDESKLIGGETFNEFIRDRLPELMVNRDRVMFGLRVEARGKRIAKLKARTWLRFNTYYSVREIQHLWVYDRRGNPIETGIEKDITPEWITSDTFLIQVGIVPSK